ncbi:hypothetical protein [Fodinicola feengrottensis]|uniref:hypothetical protein n=1 Tax=Fodinicola feengrottensis TaxID=435914 RepID=UPI0013D7C37D|nr:hypothetical protein [Fodinicola feengrottensis]
MSRIESHTMICRTPVVSPVHWVTARPSPKSTPHATTPTPETPDGSADLTSAKTTGLSML